MRNESGFTLIETVTVVLIILLFIGASSFGYVCFVKNADYQESKTTGNEIVNAIHSEWLKSGKLAMGESSSVDEYVIDKFVERIESVPGLTRPELRAYIKDRLYEIDYSSTMRRQLEKPESYISQFVVFIDEEDGKLSHYQGTVLRKNIIDGCTLGETAIYNGKGFYDRISDLMKYEISNDYYNCPNEELCNRLGE